jgi:hypothetical protein
MKVEDELRIRLDRAGEAGPLRPIEAEDLVRRGRASRRRRMALAAVGAAAVLAATAVLVTVTGIGEQRGLPPVKGPERSEILPPSPAEREAEALVQMWVRLLATGENERAWEFMSARSREKWASKAAFADSANGWKDLYGVWADAAHAEYRASTIRLVGRDAIVVTVDGEVETGHALETNPTSASFIVTTEGERDGVSPFEGPGSIEFVTPTFAAEGSGQTEMPAVGPQPEIEVTTYPKVKDALMLVDGPETSLMEPATVDRSPGSSRITYVPSERLGPGIYTATVVAGGPLDAIDTWAVRFEVR